MEAIATITPKKYQGNAGLYSIQDSFELDLTTMRFGGDDWTPNLLIIWEYDDYIIPRDSCKNTSITQREVDPSSKLQALLRGLAEASKGMTKGAASSDLEVFDWS